VNKEEIYGLACEVQVESSDKEIVLRSLVDGTEWRLPLSAEFSDVYKQYIGKRCWLSLSLASELDDVTLVSGGGRVQMGIPMTELEYDTLKAEAEAAGVTVDQLIRERVGAKSG